MDNIKQHHFLIDRVIYTDTIIRVATLNIVIPYNRIDYNLWKYIIEIDKNVWHETIYRYSKFRDIFWIDLDYWKHPHVSDWEPCYWNMTTLIQSARRDGNFWMLTSMIIEFLLSYNQEWAREDIEEF